MQVHLFRHFAHQGKAGAFYGSTNLELKNKTHLALTLKEGTKVFSSPLLRCTQSLDRLQLKSELNLEDAKEVDFGYWEGLTYTEIEQKWPLEVKAWQEDEDFYFPQGEKIKENSLYKSKLQQNKHERFSKSLRNVIRIMR